MNTAIIMAAIASAASVAHASDDAAARSAVGLWRLSAIGGKVGCTVSLTDREGSGGLDIQAPAACQRAFPPLKMLSVWNLDARSGLVFSDPARGLVVAFRGPLGGPYEAVAPDGRQWRLAAAPFKTPVDRDL